MRRTFFWAGAALVLVLAAILSACGSSATQSTTSQASSGSTTSSGTSSSALIKTKTATVNGKSEVVLADASGKTLYYFKLDSATTSACTASCVQNWPPLPAPASLPSSLPGLSGTLSAVQGANGSQVSYNGHPLYRFYKDGDQGDVYGEGVGGKWFVATPDLDVQSAGASAGYGG